MCEYRYIEQCICSKCYIAFLTYLLTDIVTFSCHKIILLAITGDSAGLSLQDLPTDQELAAIAPLLIENWYEIGSRLGIDKTALDRIEQELEFMKGSDRAAIEMLYMAKEKPCFTTRAELVKKLDCLGARSAAQHLMCGLYN